MNVHSKFIEIEDVRKIALPILKQRFGPYGFSDAIFGEEEAFDGEPVFRIDAKVTGKVPANEIIETLDAVHSALRARGEERLVFLTTRPPEIAEQGIDDEDVG